jgi:hypothetical protein
MIIEIILGVVCLAAILTSVFFLLRERSRNLELSLLAAQLIFDKDLLIAKIDQKEKEVFALQSEDFIQFLTKSRDYAFDYIEKTQIAVSDFKVSLEPIIKYHRTYGTVMGETREWKEMERVAQAFDKLISVLPQEDEVPNN